MKYSDRQDSAEYNLEIGTDSPNLKLIMNEIEEAQILTSTYFDRQDKAYNCWNSRWENQSIDGRRHSGNEGEDAFPFEGASDTRIRTVKEQIRDHVTLAQFAYDAAKIQAETTRPLAPGQGRKSNKVGLLVKHQLQVQMRNQLDLEVPLSLAWRFGYGHSLLGVDWWQCRRLDTHPINVEILAGVVAARFKVPPGEAFLQIQSALADPAQSGPLIEFIKTLSPLVTTAQARKVLEDLQQLRFAEIKVPFTFRSQPQMNALRIGVDVLFRDLTGDIQAEPWVARCERISETDLYDRIETDGYDPGFVREAVKHKGESSDDIWVQRTLIEREAYTGYRPGWVNNCANMIDLYHFYYKARIKGVPALFRTVFNPSVTKKSIKEPLFAWHGLHPYDHGLYPMVVQRFEKESRPIRSSQGIAEIAYTWEQEIKVQADGMADRTALVNAPPLITPYSKVAEVRGTFGPRAVLGVMRPQEIQWMPLPPSDGTPVQVMQAAALRVERFFGLFGAELDPDLKNMRRQQVVKGVLNEFGIAADMILQLDAQYMTDEEVNQIIGGEKKPVSVQEISEAQVRIIFDPRTVDVEFLQQKMGLIGQALAFNQNGGANMSVVFRAAMELIEPDMADEAIQDDAVATDRERRDEMDAISRAFAGIESDLPMHGNHKLRLDVLLQNTINSQNPRQRERLAQNPDSAQILEKRLKFFQNQLQQTQQNPGIGRALTTRPFSNEAPQMAALPGAVGGT